MIHGHALSAADSLERLGIALALGFVIGFEREWRQGMAGLHTITLVAVGAVLFTLLPVLVGDAGEPMRIAGQIVTGIGFLAGGVIVREGASVRGLVTAATLWATAAIGTLVGNGFYVQAGVGTVVVVSLNSLLAPLAETLSRDAIIRSARKAMRVQFISIKVHLDCLRDAVGPVHDTVVAECNASALSLRSFDTNADQAGNVAIVFELQYPGSNRSRLEGLTRTLSAATGVSNLGWETTEHLL